MRLHILTGALAAAAALSISPAASAATVPIDYTLSVTDKGLTINFGTMILDYDGSSYMLESLVLSVPKRTTVIRCDDSRSLGPEENDCRHIGCNLGSGIWNERLLHILVFIVRRRPGERLHILYLRSVAEFSDQHCLRLLDDRSDYKKLRNEYYPVCSRSCHLGTHASRFWRNWHCDTND